jgi:hypothetical protein
VETRIGGLETRVGDLEKTVEKMDKKLGVQVEEVFGRRCKRSLGFSMQVH